VPRLDYYAASPSAMAALMALEIAVEHLGLPAPLLLLVKLRVSQINHCAFCVDLHAADALRAGVPAVQLQALTAWRAAACFSGAEREALALAEALLETPPRLPAPAYLSVPQLAALTLAVNLALAWNHLGVGFRAVPPL
jgi:AhpD family alkylhydroperoxidase